MAWVEVGKAGDIPEGRATCVRHGHEGIAVFNVGGRLYACDDACPHAGGPLHQGFITGTEVSCPWHGWTFDLTDTSDAADGLRRYTVVTGEDGVVRVEVPD